MAKYHSLRKMQAIIGEKASPKEFFLSDTFRRNVSGLSSLVSGRYGTDALFAHVDWDQNKGDVAYTDNNKVYINAGNSLTTQAKSFADKYISVVGILGHELGHVLYTDFTLTKAIYENMKNGTWLLPPLKDTDSDAFKDNLKRLENIAFSCDSGTGVVFNILKNIWNILEDIYVNDRMSKAFPGTFKTGIALTQKIMWGDKKFTYQEINGSTCINSIYYMLKFGSKNLPNEFVQEFPEILDIEREVGDITKVHEPKERLLIGERCLLFIWPYFEKNIQFVNVSMPNMQGTPGQSGSSGQGNQSGQGSNGQAGGNITIIQGSGGGNGSQPISKELAEQIKKAIEKQMKDVKGSDSKGNGKGMLNKSDDSSTQNEQSNNNNQNQNNAGGNKDKNGLKKNDNKSGNGASSDNGKDKSSEQKNKSANGKEDAEKAGDKAGDKNSDKNGEKSADSKNRNGEKKSMDGENSNGPNKTAGKQAAPQGESNTTQVFGEGSPEIEEPELKTIDTLLSEYAKELLRDNREKANSMLRNATAEDVQKTASHRNVRYTINTFTANTAKSRIYDTAFAELKTYSKRLQKDILEAIEERREGSTYSGLLRGKRLDTRAVSRNDGKIFKDNKLPGDEAELVVSVLIDQSGSMSGIKIAQAMKAAMIIEDFCRGLDIPVSIMGHCVSGGVVLNQYVDFGDDSPNRKYKLCELYAGGCNRDGFALRYAIKQIESRDEPTKLLILISDGLPNDYEYSGRVAKTDLQECVADCSKKDIIFFAAAIDQDKEQIKQIYGNSFLDITDLATFPKKMVNIIKRFAVQ